MKNFTVISCLSFMLVTAVVANEPAETAAPSTHLRLTPACLNKMNQLGNPSGVSFEEVSDHICIINDNSSVCIPTILLQQLFEQYKNHAQVSPEVAQNMADFKEEKLANTTEETTA